MKKFIFGLFVTLGLLFSCHTSDSVINYGANVDTSEVGQKAIISKKYSFNRERFNIFCQTSKIPSNINLWYNASFKDYETSKVVQQRVYLKNNDVYRLNLNVVNRDTTFIVLHRHTN